MSTSSRQLCFINPPSDDSNKRKLYHQPAANIAAKPGRHLARPHRFQKWIILEIKKSIKQNAGQPTKKWLKTKEVQGILGVSITTLLTLRINGILPFTKMGGVLYYDYDDIQAVMQKLKSNYTFLEGEKHRYKNDL